LNVSGVRDVTQTEIVPEPRAFEVEMAIEKLKYVHREALMRNCSRLDSGRR